MPQVGGQSSSQFVEPPGPQWEEVVAFMDEATIKRLGKGSLTAEALRWIDDRVEDGTYQSERQSLIEKWGPWRDSDYEEYDRWESRYQAPREFRRIKAQLRFACMGPTPEKAKPYLEAFRVLAPIPDALGEYLLPVLRLVTLPEKPPSRGRKNRRYPSDEDSETLRKMRPLIQGGMSISAAAAKVTAERLSPHVLVDSTKKRLEKWWRWKQELRKDPVR